MWYQSSQSVDAMCHFRESRDVWTETDEEDEREAETDEHPALTEDRDVEVELLTDGGDDD